MYSGYTFYMDEKHSPTLECYMLAKLLEYTQHHTEGFHTFHDVLFVIWLVWF